MTYTDERWKLLGEFQRLVLESKPEIVTMENVSRIRKHMVFREFTNALRRAGYSVEHQVVNAAEYGVPQRRKRTVLLASLLGSIGLCDPLKSEPKTVRDVIGDLAPLDAGAACFEDPMHVASNLSPINSRRIRASLPGGTWNDWPTSLRAPCHRRDSGATYPDVYGRMEWDKPSPTLTTQFYRYGTGRFGHPEQDRALSLREGSLLQGFPADYTFVPKSEKPGMIAVGRLIGNAVPVPLAEAIGHSIMGELR